MADPKLPDDKFLPDDYADAMFSVIQRWLQKADAAGIELSGEWTTPNAVRNFQGKTVIDVDESAKNMGSVTLKFSKKIIP